MGERIKTCRVALGLRQIPFSKRAKISQGTLADYENDRIPEPKASVVFRIAAALGVNATWLFTNKGMPHGLAAETEDEAKLLQVFRVLDAAGCSAVIGAAMGNAERQGISSANPFGGTDKVVTGDFIPAPSKVVKLPRTSKATVTPIKER